MSNLQPVPESLVLWPTIQEAVQLLGISPRSIRRRAQEGKLELRARPRQGKKPEPVVNPDDIAKLSAQRPHIVTIDAVDENTPETVPNRLEKTGAGAAA